MDGKKKQKIVEFIEAYPARVRSIESLKLELKRLYDQCYPNGIDTSKDKVTSSNIHDTVFETVVIIEKEKERIEAQLQRDEDFVALHDMAFGRLSDSEQEVITKLYHGRRYSDGKSWLLSHGYAYSTLYRIQKKALQKMYDTVFGGEYIVTKK